MFWKNVKKKRFAAFTAAVIFGTVLSACVSGAGKSIVPDDEGLKNVSSGKGQEDGEALQENQSLEKNSDLLDDKRKEPREFGNIPPKETESKKDSGASSDVPETMTKEQEESQRQNGENQPETQTWKSAYLEVIYHLWDYLAPRYEPRTYEDSRKKFGDPMDISIFYLGLHDFDGDGTLELITGDGLGLAVFTYKGDHVEKIADLCPPDRTATWCVCGVNFKDHSIGVECDGSGGIEWIDFGYLEGEYMLGHYNERNPSELITINGREATKEEIEKIYTVDYDKIEEEETRERFHLTNENGTWILKATWWSNEESVLDINFDFDSVIW